MSRSVCTSGLAAALVSGLLAFGAAPARAQEYVAGSYAPAPVTSYYYPPVTYYYAYPPYAYAPVYSSYYYAPAYRDCYVYDSGWRGRWGWYGRGWFGRRWWR
jgi:hypothetical protein